MKSRLLSFALQSACRLLLCALPLGVLAQPSPALRHYSADEGLPSSELYQTLQTADGYVWFASDRGLTRFDGTNFRNYTTEQGLPDNTVIKLFEAADSTLWLATANCQLAQVVADSIRPYKYNTAIQEVIGNPLLASFAVDAVGNVHLGFIHQGYLTVPTNGAVRYARTFGARPALYHTRIDGALLHFSVRATGGEPPQWLPEQLQSVVLQEEEEPQPYYFVQRQDSGLAIAENNRVKLIYTQGDTVETVFDRRVIGLYEDDQGNIWASFFKGGMKRYVGREIRPESRGSVLPDKSVTSVYQDQEGSLWLTTLEDGVWFAPTLNIHTVNGLSDSYITTIDGDGNGNVFLGLRNGIVHRVTEHGLVVDTIDLNFGNRLPSPVSAMLYDVARQQLLLSSTSSIAVLTNDGLQQLFFPDLLSLDMPIKSHDGTYWSKGRSGLYQLTTNEVVYRSSRENRVLNVTAIHEDAQQRLWVGSTDGLYRFEQRRFVHYGSESPLLRHKILDIASLPDGRLLLATSGAGLVVVNGTSVRAITTADSLSSNMINALQVDEEGTIWAATDKGLNRISLGNNTSVRWFTRKHGLVSDEVQQVFVDSGRVWAVTNKGASMFHPKEVPLNRIKPRCYITGIQINNQDTAVQAAFELNYTQNFLRVGFVGLAFKTADAITFRYRLEGLEGGWQYTTANEVQYTTLPSGNYRFVLQAANEDGLWSDPQYFSVTITPPFWRTWWFIVFAILFGGASIYGVVYYRITQIKEQNRINQELHNYKHQALSAQMNPHFVFNCLNSIQNFILQNDRKEANRYLSKFARLMRLTLDNSREMYITLEDELSALDLYMELERLRYKNKFDYSITVDETIDQSAARIPATLIQPYVENAIWHGIVHKDTQGHVYVDVQHAGEELLCSVEDDGIGREAAEQIKNQHRIKHKSAGMDITQKRLELMNSVHKNEMKHRIIDLKDAAGNATGTRVEFNIPIVEE